VFTTVAGSLTTAAQPNITSLGTLTTLGVNGTVTAVAFTANTGVFTGNGAGLSSLVGANVTGQVGNALVAGTVYTAAQPNITSVGTLTSISVSGTTNLNAVGNITITGGTSGQVLTTNGSGVLSWSTVAGGLSNGTSSVTIPVVDSNVITTVGGTARLTVTTAGANITGTLTTSTSVLTPNLTTGANTTAGTMTGNWTLTAGSRLNATYADLAERYSTDRDYLPGTLLMIGGDMEVTLATAEGRYSLAGVVTSEPAYVLNSTLGDSVAVALVGRVPCLVTGNISKGDMLTISNIDGVATASIDREYGTIIGRALESHSGDSVDVIEVKVDRG
jgi:hypothetical protein